MSQYQTHQVDNFEISIPETWELREGMFGSKFFICPKEPDSFNFVENINLLLINKSKLPTNLITDISKYTELNCSQVTEIGGEVKEIRKYKNDAMGNYSKVIYTLPNNSSDHKLVFIGYSFMIGDNIYILTYTRTVDQNQNIEIAERIIESFKVKSIA